jgi:hypothetical protein
MYPNRITLTWQSQSRWASVRSRKLLLVVSSIPAQSGMRHRASDFFDQLTPIAFGWRFGIHVLRNTVTLEDVDQNAWPKLGDGAPLRAVQRESSFA